MFETQVAAGMKLLDEKMPGWEGKINLDKLDLYNTEKCILGQLCGDYFCAGEVCRGAAVRAAYGFTILRDPQGMFDIFEGFTALTNEWREAIQNRLTAGITPA
jgi:hypothetical protein